MTKNIVLTRMDQETFARAAAALASDEISLHHAPWDDNTLDLVQSTKFDVIIIGFPGPITPLRRFVECVRAPGSACQKSGVILLADPQHIDAAPSERPRPRHRGLKPLSGGAPHRRARGS